MVLRLSLSYAPSSLGRGGGKTAGGTMLLADISAVAVIISPAPPLARLAILAYATFSDCLLKLVAWNKFPEMRVFTDHGEICACRRVWASIAAAV